MQERQGGVSSLSVKKEQTIVDALVQKMTEVPPHLKEKYGAASIWVEQNVSKLQGLAVWEVQELAITHYRATVPAILSIDQKEQEVNGYMQAFTLAFKHFNELCALYREGAQKEVLVR